MMKKINIEEKLALFSDHWNPRIIAELNGQNVKVVKIQGSFVWHSHEDEDELFYILKGTMKMEFRDKVVELQAGEMIVAPRGVEHRPVTEGEVQLLLFEPSDIKHTGDVDDERTVTKFMHI